MNTRSAFDPHPHLVNDGFEILAFCFSRLTLLLLQDFKDSASNCFDVHALNCESRAPDGGRYESIGCTCAAFLVSNDTKEFRIKMFS